MTAAPTLYGIVDAELHDELRNIDVDCAVDLDGPVTVTAGVRHDLATGEHHPVVIVRGAAGLHLLALPGDGP